MILVESCDEECLVAILIQRVLLQILEADSIIAKVNGRPDDESNCEDAKVREDVPVDHSDPKLPYILIDQWDEYHVKQADKRLHARECY